MSKIDPPAAWSDVDVIDTFERVLGGPEGPLNRAETALTARTKFLLDAVTVNTTALADLASTDPAKGAAKVGFPDNAAPAYNKTMSDFANGVPVNLLRAIPKNRWEAIQNGTDNEDCADAIMNLMDGAYNARNAIIQVPMGKFTVHKPIQRVGGNTFRIVGEDMLRSQIARGSDWAPGVGTGSVFNISGVDGHSIENLRINGNATLFPVNANHGIACSNSNNIRYNNLYVEDCLNTGILVFHFPGLPAPGVPQETNNVISNCWIIGNGNTNNGILLADQENSYIVRCVVLDLGQSGSPQYALQFKNSCYNCHIIDGIVVNARAAVGFGQEEVVGAAVNYCSVSNVRTRACVWGIYVGQAYNCKISNIDIDMRNVAGVASGGTPIELVDSVGNSFSNIDVRNQRTTGGAAAPYTVLTTGACTDNVLKLSQLIIDSATTPRILELSATSVRNRVYVDNLRTVTTPLVYTAQALKNDNTSATAGNSLEIAGFTSQDALTIAAGVIVVRDACTALIRVNTEGAAATDDLDSITGPAIDGQRITLKSTSNSRDVVVKHGTGNIRLVGGVDFTIGTINMLIELEYNGIASLWVERFRAANT